MWSASVESFDGPFYEANPALTEPGTFVAMDENGILYLSFGVIVHADGYLYDCEDKQHIDNELGNLKAPGGFSIGAPSVAQFPLGQSAAHVDGYVGAANPFYASSFDFQLGDRSTVSAHIDVRADSPTLNPTDANPQSNVTVTVNGSDGNPIAGQSVDIRVCTDVASDRTAGHSQRPEDADACDYSVAPARPGATLQWTDQDGQQHNVGVDNGHVQFTAKTNESGQITYTYKPPKSAPVGHYSAHVIAGLDQLKAKATIDGNDVAGQATITTQVPGLVPMDNSDNCQGDGHTYVFDAQQHHACLFYGTAATNEALARIAQTFVQRQTGCAAHPGGPDCQLAQGGVVATPGAPRLIRITAMSLPWGGLNDIGPSVGHPEYPYWGPPHAAHDSGSVADIGLAGLGGAGSDRARLLRDVITGDNNFDRFPPTEGGDMRAHPNPNHYHVFFDQ
jgi:hypothetical protein